MVRETTNSAASQGDVGKYSSSEGLITDLESFNAVTAGTGGVAALYFYAVMDCLVDLAHAISQDFFRRPQLYRKFGKSDTAALLAKLHARYGSDETIPSRAQREEIFAPIFGQLQGPDDRMSRAGEFDDAVHQLLAACAAFTSGGSNNLNSSPRMLLEGVREAQRPLRDYLNSLQGGSLRWSREQALASVTEELSYPIFRDAGVAAIFGQNDPASADWPYVDETHVGFILEAICHQLPAALPGAKLTHTSFSNLYATAVRGTEALASLMAQPKDLNDDAVEDLITRGVRWGMAQQYQSMPAGPGWGQ